MYERSELDYLLTHDPVGYADLILNGDVAEYLRNVTDYRPLDDNYLTDSSHTFDKNKVKQGAIHNYNLQHQKDCTN